MIDQCTTVWSRKAFSADVVSNLPRLFSRAAYIAERTTKPTRDQHQLHDYGQLRAIHYHSKAVDSALNASIRVKHENRKLLVKNDFQNGTQTEDTQNTHVVEELLNNVITLLHQKTRKLLMSTDVPLAHKQKLIENSNPDSLSGMMILKSLAECDLLQTSKDIIKAQQARQGQTSEDVNRQQTRTKESLERIIHILKDVYASMNATLGTHPQTADTLHTVGTAFATAQKLSEAARYYNQSIAMMIKAKGRTDCTEVGMLQQKLGYTLALDPNADPAMALNVLQSALKTLSGFGKTKPGMASILKTIESNIRLANQRLSRREVSV